MRPTRIALSGKMRSGKDTVANELIMRHGFIKVSFARRLKELASDLFGMDETDKNRLLLQELGRRLCQVDPAVWIKYAMDRMPLYRNIVVTDLRFPNEYHALRGMGFKLVRIEIDYATQFSRYVRTSGDISAEDFETLRGDPSECLLDGKFRWDLVLDGTKDAGEMRGDIEMMLEHRTVEYDMKENRDD